MEQIKSNDYKSVLQKQGILAFVPDGNSMWPFIKNGKQSVIVEIPKNPIKIYDVVFFTRPDGTQILHRVLGFDNDNLIALCRYHHKMADDGKIPRKELQKLIS